jgi:tetratricopeptide (TPR) repeat protein
VISLNPNDADAYYNKANSLRMLNRFEESVKSYNRAIELNPYYSEAYNNKGLALKYINRIEESNKAFDRAIELDKNNSSAYYNRNSLGGTPFVASGTPLTIINTPKKTNKHSLFNFF